MYICRSLRWWTCRHILVSGQKNNTPLIQTLQKINRILIYKSDGVCPKSAPKSEEKINVCDDSNSCSRRPMKGEQVAQLLAGHRHLTHGQRRPIKSSAFFFKRRGTGLFQNNDLPAPPPRPHPLHTASCLILFNIQGGGVLSFFSITSIGLKHSW